MSKKDVRELDCGAKVTHFNLKKALRGDDVINSCGNATTQITSFILDGVVTVMGVNDDEIKDWDHKGRFLHNDEKAINDIFMVYKEKPKKDKNKKIKRWVNVYEENECSNLYESKKEAKENIPDYTKKDGSYVGTVKIKF